MVEAEPELSLQQLDLAQLSLFVGQQADRVMLARLHAAGFSGLRIAHGYVMLQAARRTRARLERKLLRGLPAPAVAHTREVLGVLLEKLGGAAAVRTRRVVEPR